MYSSNVGNNEEKVQKVTVKEVPKDGIQKVEKEVRKNGRWETVFKIIKYGGSIAGLIYTVLHHWLK
ncbi:MAG: hypothetical protein K0Q79_508 [Flavipsychrobacter sp.]|jgi:hypothetical protein|nr:hypothetical protein [Flavipsychrobacter sp.]